MPKFNVNDDTIPKVGNYFNFSAANISKLGSTEYTLVSITSDVSGSVQKFALLLNNALKEAVESCQKSPRADNLLLRVTTFNSVVKEFHGFKEFKNVNLSDYDNVIQNPYGATALRDAALDSLDALNLQAKELYDNDYSANAIFIQITDGDDNSSVHSAAKLKKTAADAINSEYLESIRRILVGVNPDKDTNLSAYLQRYKDEAGFDQYIEIEDTSPNAFAKLSDFISKSVSTQSQSLGSGKPSQAITF
ncbi:MAG TPA: hypothetical protein PLP33_25890 [Leptospiraceae bacterium]|nr:hypothetical protein [Leptospiraceae bacterium]